MADVWLKIRMLADAGNAKKGFAEATKGAQGFQAQLKGLTGQMMGKLGAGLAIGAVAKFATDAAGKFMDLAKASHDLGVQTGLTTEQSSRLLAVADDMEVGVGALQATFKRLNSTIDSTVWQKYGIEVEDAAGRLKPANERLLDVLDLLSKIHDPTQRAAAGVELLGKAWQGLAPLVGKSREEMQKALDAVDAGQVITQAEYERSERLRGSLDSLSDAWGHVQMAIGAILTVASPVIDLFGVWIDAGADLVDIMSGSDAGSLAGALDSVGKKLAILDGDTFGTVNAFVELSNAVTANKSTLDSFQENLNTWFTGAGEAEYAADDLKIAFKELLTQSPEQALQAAKAMQAYYDLTKDPATAEGIQEQIDKWGLSEDVIASWVTQADVAIVNTNELNANLEEQTDLLDGLVSEWEDYLGLLDMQSAADNAKNALLELAYAVDDPVTATNEFADAQKQAAKDVAAFIKQAKTMPKDVQLKMLADVDQGNLTAVYSGIEEWAKDHPVEVSADVQFQSSNWQKFMQQLGGIGGSVYNAAYGPIAGRRADGGPVAAGRPYLVGEMGPELFIPASSGGIISNGAFGGGGTVMNVTVHMAAGADGAQLVESLQRQARRAGQLPVPITQVQRR
jgi:hypothetical protein